MAELVEEHNCALAWAEGVRRIAASRYKIHQLITVISNPSFESQEWFTSYGPQRVRRCANSLRSVARMLAPEELQNPRLTRNDAYNQAWRRIDDARTRGIQLSTWRDTYFERLTRLEDGTNQIENIIQKLNSWRTKPVGSFYAHTTFATIDGLKLMGNPCLQYVQFLPVRPKRLDMVAMYRNHDFFEKAFGNFVGLGRLLAFVARHTNRDAGSLTCFSAHAYIKTSRVQVSSLAQSVRPTQTV